VDTVAEGQDAQPVAERCQGITEGVRWLDGVPAESSGARSGQHPPVLPAFEHDLVNAVNPPEGEPGANTMHHIGVTMTSILTKADLDRAQLH
jgi:hypothetical protein